MALAICGFSFRLRTGPWAADRILALEPKDSSIDANARPRHARSAINACAVRPRNGSRLEAGQFGTVWKHADTTGAHLTNQKKNVLSILYKADTALSVLWLLVTKNRKRIVGKMFNVLFYLQP